VTNREPLTAVIALLEH